MLFMLKFVWNYSTHIGEVPCACFQIQHKMDHDLLEKVIVFL